MLRKIKDGSSLHFCYDSDIEGNVYIFSEEEIEEAAIRSKESRNFIPEEVIMPDTFAYGLVTGLVLGACLPVLGYSMKFFLH